MLKQLYRAVVINHERQRYATTGDWQFDPDGLLISVSHMHNEDYEFLVAIHENVEAWLCRKAGIEEHNVTEFDERYENSRECKFDPSKHVSGLRTLPLEWWDDITETSEPGDDRHAPYYKQHQIAEGFTRILAAELGVDWNSFERANLALYEQADKRENE